jgi:hypothetical protein
MVLTKQKKQTATATTSPAAQKISRSLHSHPRRRVSEFLSALLNPFSHFKVQEIGQERGSVQLDDFGPAQSVYGYHHYARRVMATRLRLSQVSNGSTVPGGEWVKVEDVKGSCCGG